MKKRQLKKKFQLFTQHSVDYTSVKRDFRNSLSWQDQITFDRMLITEGIADGTYQQQPKVQDPNYVHKQDQADWDIKHPKIRTNQFHQLEGEELEALAELNEIPALGETNSNLNDIGETEKPIRGGWTQISKTQPNGPEEELDSYGLRRFWNTKPNHTRRSQITTTILPLD